MRTDSFKVGDLVVIKASVRKSFDSRNPYCNHICEIVSMNFEYYYLRPIIPSPPPQGGFYHNSVVHIRFASTEDIKSIKNLDILKDLNFDNQGMVSYLPLLEQYPE